MNAKNTVRAVAAAAAVALAAGGVARGEKIATQKWAKEAIAAAVAATTNGLDAASVEAIVEARENNGELYADDDGPYYFVLTRRADGTYYNRRVNLTARLRTETGTLQGAYVYSSTIAGILAGDMFGFVMKDGGAVLRNASNEFAYAETLHAAGRSWEWYESVLTNEVAYGRGCMKRHRFTLKSADGGEAVLWPNLLLPDRWMAVTGEGSTNAYAGVDAAVHWPTSNVYCVGVKTYLGFDLR